jgi:outer membrane murein-binding lipoprotein Lpp
MKAEALATGLYNSQDRIIENLATKQDVELVKEDLEVVKQELNAKIDKLDSKVDLIRKDMESNHQLVK